MTTTRTKKTSIGSPNASPSTHGLDSAGAAVSWWKRRYTRRTRTNHVPFEGKFLIGITLMVGFAAINTGNNLLFFGWGLMLASILISGVLAEATLRAVDVKFLNAGECRANATGPITLSVGNPGTRLPAFGVATGVTLQPPQWVADARLAAEKANPVTRREKRARKKVAKEAGRPSDLAAGVIEAPARYQLRMSPQEHSEIAAKFVSLHRGVHLVDALYAKTAYPFGFFEKRRRYILDTPKEVVVYPARIDAIGLTPTLLSRLGQTPTHQAGTGDEYFSMRPFRDGDDTRKIAWRVSARTGRMMMKENEVWATRELVLVFAPPTGLASDPRHRMRAEAIIAATGSIAEDLLATDHAVGVVGPGVFVPAARGPRQRQAILGALARSEPSDAVGRGTLGRNVVTIGVTVGTVPGPGDTAHTVRLPADVVDMIASPEAQ